MTTTSVLLTVSSWNSSADKCEKGEEVVGRAGRGVAAVAARELRETPATREQALRIMREWLQQNRDVANVRQDESFLLRFLRQKKYSIPMAQQTLLKYLSLRKYYPGIFKNLDCEDPNVEEIINSGYIMVSPVRDSLGRRVIAYSMSSFNPDKFTCWDMCRAHAVVLESCLADPADQVCGLAHVGDAGGVSGAHVTAWNPTDFARIMKWGEQSMPIRHKVCHIINLPTAIRYVLDFATSKITPKMAQRLKIHTNLNTLHKDIDPTCLPKAFGGVLDRRDMIQYTKKLLSGQRKTVLALDDMEILSTRGIASSRGNNKASVDAVEGSFRKLDID